MTASFSWVGIAVLLFGWGSLLGSSDVVPLPEDPVVAQVAPAECLFYSSWTGKKPASPDAASSTERLFSDPKFLDYLQHVDGLLHQTISQGVASQGIGQKQVEGAFYLLDHLHSHAGSFYISQINAKQNQMPEIFGGLVIRIEDDNLDQFTETLESLLKYVPAQLQSPAKSGDSKFSKIDLGNDIPPITWGIQENYLIVGIGAGEAEKIVERLHGSAPSWLTEAKQAVQTPRPSSFVHLDIQRLFSTIREFLRPRDELRFVGVLEAFGLDAMESFSYGGGLNDQGTVSRGLLKLSGELRGMLTLLDCEPLVAADFEQISSESPFALAFQLNLADALNAFLDSCEHEMAPQFAAETAQAWRQNLKRAKDQLGVDLQDDLLASMGDTWRIFARPGPEALTGGWTLSIDLKDSAKFLKIHNQLLQDFRQKIGNGGSVRIVSQKNEQAEFHSAHINGFPLVPTWSIYQDRLLITTSTIAAHRLLTAKAPEKTLAESAHVGPFLAEGKRTFKLLHLDLAAVMEQVFPLVAQQLDSMPAGSGLDSSLLPPLEIVTKYLRPTVIAVERTAAGVEMTHHGTLPGIDLGQAAPLLVGTTLPAVGGARNAARQAQSINNQKQIGLAMHNFHSTQGAFPAGYNADDEGKPLLSWRVHILPFIEGQQLYEQFHLDEPWDSPHNKKLIAQMPKAYRSPHSNAEQGKTTYLGVGGADGIFVRPQDGSYFGVGIREITDGTSNTVMTVEVSDKRAIEWTRPGDFAPNKDDPKQGLRIDPRRGMSLGFSDGSVRSIPKSVAKETLMGLFTKSGGERVKLP